MARVKFGRRGLVVAAVTALIVFGTILAQQVLSTLISLATVPAGSSSFLPLVVGQESVTALTGSLPLSVGLFLSLWQLAPIGAELRLAHVLSRALLASGIGAALVAFVWLVVGGVETVGRLFDSETAEFALFAFGSAAFSGVQRAGLAFVETTPLILLSGVLLWLWLREHTRDYDVSGMLDL
ncbi:hypothetical protein ABIB15_001390 [Marisediminicola sp. UYEF4]|uniref:hypothetical protein n=1 Tax=Marisediminicola sp. UYEF4 TaxID=1756384 RepID=UPI003396E0D0